MKHDQYNDIINLPHHISKNHPRMKRIDRAAQFSPFAALTGHHEAIQETARLVDEKLELDEYQTLEINQKLNEIKNNIHHHPLIYITYFQKDPYKSGGSYITLKDTVQKLDDYQQIIILNHHLKIHFDDIYTIHIE